MTVEDRLRAAITARTTRVDPSADALDRIEEQLMDTRRTDHRNRILLGLAAAVVLLALVVGALALTRGDDEVDTVDAPTTTTDPSATSTTETTAPFAPSVDPTLPIWPRFHTAQRFDDPVSAARSFVVDFVGMTDPLVGPFQQGDSRSGEVPVQPAEQGPVSTVLVRQLEDDTWFVIGSTTEHIRLDSPAALSDIDCPVRLQGEALAFEGHVDVAIRDDYSDEPIGTGFVTGGGGPGAPFDDEVECDLDLLDDGVHLGTIVLTTRGGEDGRIWQVVAVRVALK